jgi:glutaminyl-peptide cyclotransferase
MRASCGSMVRTLSACMAAAVWCAVSGACRPADELAPSAIPVYSYEVVQSFPHDPGAFTQGLQYHEGYLYETTGLHGRSTLRQVEVETGRVLRRLNLPERYFGEGLAVVGGRIYVLTWKSERGFIFDLETFQRLAEFDYEGEGWGLAYDGIHLIMSDGTSRLRFMDPDGFRPVRTLDVTADGQPLENLNELAWVQGEIWANIWKSERLARIDPSTGAVRAWIDLSGILDPRYVTRSVDVLNGIAYDEEGDRIFVTGKLWPRLFEIRVVGGDESSGTHYHGAHDML